MNPNELKSAEGWIHGHVTDTRKCLCHQCAVARQIQLNAFRAGMTKSAEITRQGDGYEHKAGYWSEKIMDARDKKETL